jgi:hypothetical protein
VIGLASVKSRRLQAPRIDASNAYVSSIFGAFVLTQKASGV